MLEWRQDEEGDLVRLMENASLSAMLVQHQIDVSLFRYRQEGKGGGNDCKEGKRVIRQLFSCLQSAESIKILSMFSSNAIVRNRRTTEAISKRVASLSNEANF